eukprot:2407730-Rhodomonas_salina.2
MTQPKALRLSTAHRTTPCKRSVRGARKDKTPKQPPFNTTSFRVCDFVADSEPSAVLEQHGDENDKDRTETYHETSGGPGRVDRVEQPHGVDQRAGSSNTPVSQYWEQVSQYSEGVRVGSSYHRKIRAQPVVSYTRKGCGVGVLTGAKG